MSEYQEEVLTGLLDLQAELRGDEPEPHDPAKASSEEEPLDEVAAEPEDAVVVSEGDVTVSLSPAASSSGAPSSGSLSSASPSSGSLVSGSSDTGLGVNERLAALLQVMTDSPLAMPYAIAKAQLMNAGDYTPGFPVELALKDIRLTEQAEGLQPPLVRAVEERLQRAVDAGHAHDDVAAVAAVV